MRYINRWLSSQLNAFLSVGKSILLLGPRQTGKTTMLTHHVNPDLNYSLLVAKTRQSFEQDPDKLIQEVKAFRKLNPSVNMPLIMIDEVQKVPAMMDVAQFIIDQKLALLILTGSSTRKLKRRNEGVNLLPGRVIELHMDALSIDEMGASMPSLNELLLFGSLPEVISQSNDTIKDRLLSSYVSLYLEEEIRAEALVRNIAAFSHFLKYAAIDAGNPFNVNNLSQEIGVSRQVINEYYQILEDCLVVYRVEPLTKLSSRRRLAKTSKYLFFDLGVRRIAAGEGSTLPEKYYGDLFEQFIGLEIRKFLGVFVPQARLLFWKDHDGPEVDYIIELNHQYVAIEVKYTMSPKDKHAKHLRVFAKEYNCVASFVICRVERAVELSDGILAINWSMLTEVLKKHL